MQFRPKNNNSNEKIIFIHSPLASDAYVSEALPPERRE